MRPSAFLFGILLVAVAALSSCRSNESVAQSDSKAHSGGSSASRHSDEMTLPSGTAIHVSLSTPLSSKTASVGDSWNGTTTRASVVDGREVIPAGSPVSGTVTSAKAARRGDRAMLDLGLSSVTVNGHRHTVHGSTEAIIAGSPRARNLGAIAGSAGAGALIGKAVSGTGKGALIGGLVGGGVATGVVAASDGHQVVLKEGTSLTFTTSSSIAMR